MGTKAQQALKLQHEQNKLERKNKSREQKEAEKERQYALRHEKKTMVFSIVCNEIVRSGCYTKITKQIWRF